MKAKILLLLVAIITIVLPLWGNGVMITGENNDCYYLLVESEISVEVEDQVAIVKSTQNFNNLFVTNSPKYVFPMPEGASATQLRWCYNEIWYTAEFAPVPQDSIPPIPSGGWPENLRAYMGDNPLFFTFENNISSYHDVIVELTYVKLLPYSLGAVTFEYQNNYDLIQSYPLDYMSLDFQLSSQRSITGIDLLGLPASITNDGHNAQLNYLLTNQIANVDFVVSYTLDPEEFGLFSMSTKLDEVPDEHPEGFFLFIAEPDPSDNQIVIDKTFTLIVDRSGSMAGQKIIQARNAANYIVDHLNPNDTFNIISFASDVTSFSTEHLLASEANRIAAHSFINSLVATGATNISEAFSNAVPQFNNADPDNANIIIFFTDGEATAGICETNALRQHVSLLVAQTERVINLFNFGIGSSVNEQLLTLLAQDHNGIAAFLGDNDLETEITGFYNIIANPVLIHPYINFSAMAGITEVYPNPLQNVYQGYQMLVMGRYATGGDTEIELCGQNYLNNVVYDYNMNLADSLLIEKQFLTKIWAKMKIEYLMAMYFSYPEGSVEAEQYKQEVIFYSLAYGVISPFTSFIDGEEIGIEDDVATPNVIPPYTLKGNFPNPFNPSTTIRFGVNRDIKKMVKVRIYNLRGQKIKTLALSVDGKGEYEVLWDGTDMQGKIQPSAVYFYVIDFGDAQLCGKMVMKK